MRQLSTVEEVVQEMGGISAAAAWAGIGYTGVHNWIDRGYIPPAWHWELETYMRDRGAVISADVFGAAHRRDARPRRQSEQKVA